METKTPGDPPGTVDLLGVLRDAEERGEPPLKALKRAEIAAEREARRAHVRSLWAAWDAFWNDVFPEGVLARAGYILVICANVIMGFVALYAAVTTPHPGAAAGMGIAMAAFFAVAILLADAAARKTWGKKE